MLQQGKDAYQVASHVAKASGILKELYDDKTVEGLSRYENVQGLLNAIKEFVDNQENEDKSLAAFLQTVSLLTTADEADDDNDNDRVTMMTIHGAKGLEFNHVYIVGLEEDLFPSQMMLESREDLEEERRLFYVAITRAEKRLIMSFAETRYQWGRLKPCEPSRFLKEIDEKYVHFSRTLQRSINPEPATKPSGFQYVTKRPEPQRTAAISKPTSSPVASSSTPENFKPSDTTQIAVGQRVLHQKFGQGVVKRLDINGMERKAVIDFEQMGEKTLLLSFAKLQILEG
jgi:DNA helicase-2/ATP-dependent DNA helicase PcrA